MKPAIEIQTNLKNVFPNKTPKSPEGDFKKCNVAMTVQNCTTLKAPLGVWGITSQDLAKK